MPFPCLSRPVVAAATAVALAAGLAASGSAAPVLASAASEATSAVQKTSGAAAKPVEASVVRHAIPAVGGSGDARTGRRYVTVTSAWAVSGYAAVGLSWNRGDDLAATELYVRTYDDQRWSDWQDLDAEDDDMPDGQTIEAGTSRPGTAPLLVGDVERVQVKVVSTSGGSPEGLRLAIVDPGTSSADAVQDEPVASQRAATASSTPTASAAAGIVAQPEIYTRAQWGADEDLRSGTPNYGSVQTTFVHHTVNTNDYAAEDVPAMIRSIYAYHTQVRGWSDIGYNVIVDRFGRLWEGRSGGLEASVVGAHTLGYNEESFGVSAIGNFEEVRPSTRMVDGLARVLSWKLDTAGLPANGTVTVDGASFRPINGHRDAAATACPGGYLYAALPAIRTQAAALIAAAGNGSDAGGRDLHRAANADDRPDVVVRAGDELRSMLGDAGPGFRAATADGSKAGRLDTVTGVGDLDGDGRGDVLVRYRDGGAFEIRTDDGQGGLSRVVREGGTRFASATSLAGAADLTGDGLHDLIVRMPDGAVKVAAGRATGFAAARTISTRWSAYTSVLGAGDLDGDGVADLLLVDADGVLWSVRGRGDLRYGVPVRRGGGWNGRTNIVAGLDLTGDRRPDLMSTDEDTGLTWIRPATAAGDLGAPIGGWAGWAAARTVTATTDISGDRFADVVLVDSDGRMSVRSSRHGMWLRPAGSTAGSWSEYRWLGLVGDWDGDGTGDLAGIADDRLWIFPGQGGGVFGTRTGGWSGWTGFGRVSAADDWDGDGSPDLMSRTADGDLWLHRGLGADGVADPVLLRAVAGSVDAVLPVGFWDADDVRDLVAVVDGELQLWAGTGTGALAAPVNLAGASGLGRYRRISGAGDLSGDGQPDLLAVSRRTGNAFILPGSTTGLGAPIRIGRGWDDYSIIG